MSRAIQIAQSGLGTTAPNPSVGAVIVYDEKIVGEGFTSAFGGAHAEVNAINSVVDKTCLKKSTLYVTLEPCSHFGLTPPCADLIIKFKIPVVIIGLLDPNEKVAGKGIDKLRGAGIVVTSGIMALECREHHRRFLAFHEKKRPYVILKWAQTADGFIAPEKLRRRDNPEPYWISNTYSQQLTHKWRSEEQAILVGTNTVLEDDPSLNVRHWNGKNPRPIVIDKTLKIPDSQQVFQLRANSKEGGIATLVLTEIKELPEHRSNVQYGYINFSRDIAIQICSTLFEENITSVLIEGGAKTIQTFIDANLWDEARIFESITRFEKGIKAPTLTGKTVASQNLGTDRLNIINHD